MGALTQEELENEIRDCGLFRAKAKNLLATCHMLVQEYNSTVPDTIEKLMTLLKQRKTQAIILLVSHDQKVLEQCDEVIDISDLRGN